MGWESLRWGGRDEGGVRRRWRVVWLEGLVGEVGGRMGEGEGGWLRIIGSRDNRVGRGRKGREGKGKSRDSHGISRSLLCFC